MHEALQKVLSGQNLVKDIKNLLKACKTAELEAFYGMLLKYHSKKQEFDQCARQARLQLAILDHNNNIM